MAEEQALEKTGDAVSDGLEERAAELVHPASGLANDYLNNFNEVLLLIENLPMLLPEMMDELLEWKAVTYREYFANSPLPGSEKAIEIYDSLDDDFRREFETVIDGVNAMAVASVEVIKAHRNPDGTIDADRVTEFCENASCAVRTALNRAADLVNNGRADAEEAVQSMADRIVAA